MKRYTSFPNALELEPQLRRVLSHILLLYEDANCRFRGVYIVVIHKDFFYKKFYLFITNKKNKQAITVNLKHAPNKHRIIISPPQKNSKVSLL